MVEDRQSHASPDAICLHTIPEAYRRLNVSRSTLYQLAKSGAFVIRKVGAASRIRSDELDAYIKGLPRLISSEPGDE